MDSQMIPVPYLASLGWYSCWLSALLEGADEAQARLLASRSLNIRTKGWCRTLIEPAQTGKELLPGQPLLLSVPVIGGNSMVKSNRVCEFRISGHGDWPRTHIGALEAACGRLPYYRYFNLELESILRDAPGRLLTNVSENIHDLVCRILNIPQALSSLSRARTESPERFASIKADLLNSLPAPDISIISSLSSLGNQALLAL